MRGGSLLTKYYLATPLFAIADLGFGVPVRVAVLGAPWHRIVYYCALFGLGLLCRFRPAVTPWTGMIESSVNLFILLLSILLSIWSLPEAAFSGASLEVGLSGYGVANAVLSGSALVLSFHRHRDAAARSLGVGGPPRR